MIKWVSAGEPNKHVKNALSSGVSEVVHNIQFSKVPLKVDDVEDSSSSDDDASLDDLVPKIKLSPVKLDMKKIKSDNNQWPDVLSNQNSSAKVLAQIFSKNYSVERKGNSRLIFRDNSENKNKERLLIPKKSSPVSKVPSLKNKQQPHSAGVKDDGKDLDPNFELKLIPILFLGLTFIIS